eukprot:gene7246-33428_t
MINPATWLPCYCYILITQIHLAAPLSGHDKAGSTDMLRTFWTGLASAAVAAVNFAMRGVVFACFAGWIGTFWKEWTRLQRRSMRAACHHALGRCTDNGLMLLYFIKWAHAARYQPKYSDKRGRWKWKKYGEEIGGVRFGEGKRDFL